MKRILILIILGLFLTSFVFAANDTQATTEEILDELENQTREALRNKSLLEYNNTQIFTTPLPGFLEKPTRIAFNIPKEKEVNLESFIVLLATIILIFLIMFDILSLTIFSETNSAMISAGISIVIMVTGVVPMIGFFIIDFLGKINLTKTWIIIVVTIILLSYIILRVLLKQKLQNRINNAYKKGAHARMASIAGERLAESISE
jgi:hypothetical protein